MTTLCTLHGHFPPFPTTITPLSLSTLHAVQLTRLCMCLQGVSTGTNIPVYIQQVSSLTASTTVNVVSTFVCLTKISVVAYTGAAWLSPPASVSPVASVTAQLVALQVSCTP